VSGTDLREQVGRNGREAIRFVGGGERAVEDGDLLEALEHYASATQRDESLSAGWNNFGVALMQAERYADADAALLFAQRADPTDPRPAYNRGLLNFERGYLRNARSFFETSLEAEPQYLPALWGVIKCDRALAQMSRTTLQHVRRALLLETEPRFVETLQRLRIEIEDGLNDGSES